MLQHKYCGRFKLGPPGPFACPAVALVGTIYKTGLPAHPRNGVLVDPPVGSFCCLLPLNVNTAVYRSVIRWLVLSIKVTIGNEAHRKTGALQAKEVVAFIAERGVWFCFEGNVLLVDVVAAFSRRVWQSHSPNRQFRDFRLILYLSW